MVYHCLFPCPYPCPWITILDASSKRCCLYCDNINAVLISSLVILFIHLPSRFGTSIGNLMFCHIRSWLIAFSRKWSHCTVHLKLLLEQRSGKCRRISRGGRYLIMIQDMHSTFCTTPYWLVIQYSHHIRRKCTVCNCTICKKGWTGFLIIYIVIIDF